MKNTGLHNTETDFQLAPSVSGSCHASSMSHRACAAVIREWSLIIEVLPIQPLDSGV